jgi:hypothetical protein
MSEIFRIESGLCIHEVGDGTRKADPGKQTHAAFSAFVGRRYYHGSCGLDVAQAAQYSDRDGIGIAWNNRHLGHGAEFLHVEPRPG